MKVQERIVSVKRHTIGYVIGGEEYTRLQAIKVAKQGTLSNARVIDNAYGPHLVGVGGTSIYGLPTRLGTSRRFANKRSK